MPRLEVAGKTALVTGSARGIGFATAKALHDRGASVVVCDLDQEASEAAAGLMGSERTLGMACDVTDRGALNRTVAAAVETFGGLDIVVANAGIAPRAATVRAMGDEEYEAVMAVNMEGVWNTVRAAMPQIVERRGHMVVVSSVYAFMNGMSVAPYAIAKAGVEALGRTLRRELRLHGASASVAYFGFIDTTMVQEGIDQDPLGERVLAKTPRLLRKRLQPSQAGEAVARGIERRAATILVPRRWRLLKWSRGFSDPLEDRLVLGDSEMMAIMAETDRA
jgi:NAD(P)-dependent dehydrogenase (short-subunit alcohol dehydrogenase family)